MSPPTTNYRIIAITLAAALLANLGGCPNFNPPTTENDPAGRLQPFESPNELLDYFRDQTTRQRRSGRGGIFNFLNVLASPATAEDGAAGDDQATDFTTTNIQEAGVDEADRIKTDGQHLFLAAGRSLRIVSIDPANQLASLASLDLDERIDSLYLSNNTLIALANKFPDFQDWPGGRPEVLSWPPYYDRGTLVVYQIDITDRANPTVTARAEFDGTLATSRLIDDHLHLVLSISPPQPDNPATLELDDVLPTAQRSAGPAPLVPWENWLRPTNPDGYFMTAVVTIDANNVESVLGSVAVMANTSTVYASTDALYLTDAQYTPSGFLRAQTTVHKFDLTGGAPTYVASGIVPGRLLNQFSLGEYEGDLRLASQIDGANTFNAFDEPAVVENTAQTADDPTAPPADGPSSAVYVLRPAGDQLEIIGRVENLAPGERIYSARFLGDRGYLVTFEQIDPLFVVDLADATNPTVVGELKIPGYSEYLHPISPDLLLGVGRSTTTAPWGGILPDGLQVSLFDVSTPASPVLIDQQTYGGYGSLAHVSWDHKAFAYLASQRLLALPSTLTPDATTPDEFANRYQQTVLCLTVDPDSGFSETGRLAAVADDLDFGPYFVDWLRTVIVADRVHAVTPDGVRRAAFSDMQTVDELTFAEDG